MASKKSSQTSAQAPRASSPGVLKLLIGKCLTASNKRFFADLHKIARALNRARTLMMRSWLDYVRANNLTERPYPAKVEIDGKERSFQAWLYNQYKLNPEFSLTPEGELPIAHTAVSQMLSSCAKAVMSKLTTKAPKNGTGRGRFVWEQIRFGECRVPEWNKELYIPVAYSWSPLAWNVHEEGGVLVNVTAAEGSQSIKAAVEHYGKDECVLAVPLFSGQAGRKHLYHVVRLNVKHLPAGLKENLRAIIRGAWKYCDSKLVWQEVKPNSQEARKGRKGHWWFHLTYEQPAGTQVLDPSRVTVLTLNDPDAVDPFTVSFENHKWSVGRGAPDQVAVWTVQCPADRHARPYQDPRQRPARPWPPAALPGHEGTHAIQ